jgi:hypothetical protein
MRVGAPDELSAVLLAERLGRDRCRIGQQSDDSWYLEFNRPPTPGPAAELLAEVRRWLAAERIAQTIVWIGEQPFLCRIGLTWQPQRTALAHNMPCVLPTRG